MFYSIDFCLKIDQDVAVGLKDQEDFIFCKSDSNKSFSEKMSTINQILSKVRDSPALPNPKAFKTLASYFIFGVSITELPIKGSLMKKIRRFREDIGSYDSLSLWGFLSPTQQAIMDCENLDKVILTAPYSCGKTTVLTERTLKLDKKGEKVLFINGTGTRSQSTTKSLMSLELEQQFKKVPNVSFMTLSSQEIVKLTKPFNQYRLHDITTEFMQKFKDQNYYLVIDEFILQTKRKKGGMKDIQEANNLFNALSKHFKSV